MAEDGRRQDHLLFHGLEQNGLDFSVNSIALQVEFPAFNFNAEVNEFSVALDWVLIIKKTLWKIHFFVPLL